MQKVIKKNDTENISNVLLGFFRKKLAMKALKMTTVDVKIPRYNGSENIF
jgi:hypothetical protein